MFQNCRDVGTNEVLAFTNTNNQWACLTHSYEFLRLMLCQYTQCKCATQQRDHFLHCFNDITIVFTCNQVRDNLSICLGSERVTLSHQFILQIQVVLNNTVMHNRELLASIRVWMRVLI
ncbi:hypothetical protein D3C76_1033530 [compost metagenome]